MAPNGKYKHIFMKVITIINRKGGSGKTTVAQNLASAFALAKYDTVLIDADPQASALRIREAREKDALYMTMGMPHKNIHKDIPKLSHDLILIDTPPQDENSAIQRSAMIKADLVLIPIKPSPLDVWACEPIAQMIQEVRTMREDLKACFLITMRIVNSNIGIEVFDAVKELFIEEQIEVLTNSICNRVAYTSKLGEGLSVVEFPNEGRLEIKRLMKEIEGILE